MLAFNTKLKTIMLGAEKAETKQKQFKDLNVTTNKEE